MKTNPLTLLSILCMGASALAQSSTEYQNTGTVSQPINIDAGLFQNQGNFNLSGIQVEDNETIIGAGITQGAPYFTLDTTNYNNSGFMLAEPGFDFEDYTSRGEVPSAIFDNSGTIVGFDTPVDGIELVVVGGYYAPPAFVTAQEAFGANYAVPSVVQVSAANITNTGTIQVGDLGSEIFAGQNVSLANGALASGTISDADTNGNADRGVLAGVVNGTTTNYVFSPPVGVYDLFWSTGTNSLNLANLLSDDLPDVNFGDVISPEFGATNRVGTNLYELPESGVEAFVPYVFTESSGNSNYYNIILLNTAFSQTNITAEAGFLDTGEGTEDIIQFGATVLDDITGQTVTNAVYLLDSGAVSKQSFAANLNFITLAYGKPDTFEITTTTPYEWTEGLSPGNSAYDPTLIYASGIYNSNTENATIGAYGVQINSNPGELDGLFPLTTSVEGTDVGLDIPNLTNRSARISVSANKLDLSNTRLRANGTVTFNATNITGMPSGMDFDSANIKLGSAKTSVSISNLVPSRFNRLRGDIFAYSADWQNLQTNDGAGNKVTNTIFVHLLIVDQSLQSSFVPSVINVAATGTNIVISDPMVVLQSASFQTTNLTINNTLHLTGAADILGLTNLPGLQSMDVTTNGSLEVDDLINLGVSTTAAPVSPPARKYTVNSITNLGTVSSGGVSFQTRTFANGGNLISGNGSSILMYAQTNLLGVGVGLTNSLVADGQVVLSSVNIQASNSTILAGQDGNGGLTLIATSQLTDMVPGVPSTNVYGTNFWQVTSGFTLAAKPPTGDLFGTQIRTIAANYGQVVNHTWAGVDMGANVAGFYNNEVVGHLIIDRTVDGATLRFSAAGKKNAMYVDYLELRDLSFSDYHNGLKIDPNFTIYFANCNFDPSKLHSLYTNIVWVPQFAGPNSSAEVLYRGGSNCIMNALVATSSEISSDFDGIPNSKKEPYILDNPNLFIGTIPCPTSIATTEEITVTNNGDGVNQTLIVWTIGQGMATPALKNISVGENFSQTAVPAAGWTFLSWSGAVFSTLPAISFRMPPTNAALTATFIPSPFPALAGTYNGLFAPTNVTATNSGFVTFTVNNTGAFSGHLQINSLRYSFSSQFYGNGKATVNAVSGTNVLSVTLQIDTTNTVNPSTQVTGSVSGGNWESTLNADLAPTWTAKDPAPQTGSYTMVLPGNPIAVASPGGDSYGTASVTTAGVLTAVLNLADAASTSFSQSVPVSASGLWPLYLTPATTAVQPLIGWITFNTNKPASLSGTVNWIKAAAPGAFYPNGFNVSSTLQGSIYAPTNVLVLSNPSITLTGGNLPATVVNPVTVSAKVNYKNAAGNLTLSINQSTGAFTGNYQAAGSKVKTPLAGVVLQDQGVAQGFFLGTNQSGAVLLQGN